MRRVVFVLAALALGACAHANADNLNGWGRVDCQSGAENPKMQADLEQAKLVCEQKAQAAAVSGSVHAGNGYGAVAGGIAQGLAHNDVKQASFKACMAERGYLFSTRSEFRNRCSR